MFKKILLPLDGSEAAEVVLAFGCEMARKMGSHLVLFHSCNDSHRGSKKKHGVYLEKQAELTRQKLTGSVPGKTVTVVHKSGEFIPVLIDFVDHNEIDLIIMVAHGATDPHAPSIVDDVVRLARCATLLVRPKIEAVNGVDLIRRLLVPLDGTPYSQQILALAKPMAEKMGTEILLFSAVKASGQSPATVDNQKKSLEKYLGGVSVLLKETRVTTMIVEADDFAIAIDQAATHAKADMVMMITNSPVTEWAENSRVRKLLKNGAISLMVKHRV